MVCVSVKLNLHHDFRNQVQLRKYKLPEESFKSMFDILVKDLHHAHRFHCTKIMFRRDLLEKTELNQPVTLRRTKPLFLINHETDKFQVNLT